MRSVAAYAQDAVATAPAADSKGALVGTISGKSGKGIAGAKISISNGAGFDQSVITDGQGLYAVTDLPGGKYSITVSTPAGKTFESSATLSPGQVLTLALGSSTHEKATLTGTLTDASGTGVASASVLLDNGNGTPTKVETDAQGVYRADDLPAGTYSVSFVVNGAAVFQASVDLQASSATTLGVGGSLVAQAEVAAAAPASSPTPQASSPASQASTPATPVAAAAHQPQSPSAQDSANQVVTAIFGNLPSSLPAQPGQTSAPAEAQNSPVQSTAAEPPPVANEASIPRGNGSISGVVNDQTGAVVAGASVKVSNAAGQTRRAVADDRGNYTIKELPPGSYNIEVTSPNFKTFNAASVALSSGQSLPIDAALEPAGEKTEVNVSGETIGHVEVDTAQVSGTITEKEVLTLGLNGRNFTQLIALTPGVSNQTGQDEAKVGVTGSVKYSVNGGRVEYNTFEVDGSDVLNAGLNGAQSTLVVYPSLDAIQEVKVLTSNYGAMYGRTASGTVIVTTKSGGQHFHGSAYEFLRNEAFNARNYFDQTSHAPKYRRNDFGVSIGGPLFIPHLYNTKKEKTFFFYSEEARIENSPSDLQPNFNRGVPSLAERNGDFSDVCPAVNTVSEFSRQAWPDCPSNTGGGGTPLRFTNNIIFAAGTATVDPVAQAWLSTNLIPLPNSSSGCNSTTGSCYDAVISEPTHWREELFKIDHQLTPKLRASFRYIHDSWDTVTPIPEWGVVENTLPTVQNKFTGPGISLVAHLSYAITPALLNEFTASYTNSHITLEDVNGPGGADFHRPAGLGQPGGPCTTIVIPLPNPNAPPVEYPSCPLGAIFNNGFGGKAPGLVIGGTNAEYGGNGFVVDPSYMPWEHTNPTFSYRDDVFKSIGKHTLQFGAQLIFSQKNEDNNAIGAASGDVQGLLRFSNINGGPTNTGNAFANFLALFDFSGKVVNNIQSYTQDSRQFRYYNRYVIGEPYVQDDWKVTPHLTLNLGVRFSLFGVFHEKYLRAYNWDPAAYSPDLASQLRVDPVSGQLISRLNQLPIPLTPNSLGVLDPRITNGLVQCGVNNVPQGCMKGHVFNPAPRIGFAWDPRGDGKMSIRAGYGIFFEHGTGDEANTGSLEASAPNVISITQRFPQNYGCIGGSQPTCAVGPGAYPIDVTAIPTRAMWSYAQQWSLGIQRELPNGMVATASYVGSKGTHLTVERQLNQIKPLPSNLNPYGLHQPLIPRSITGGTTKGDCGSYGQVAGSASSFLQFTLQDGTIVSQQDPAYVNLIAACEGENDTQSGLQPTPNVNTLRPYPGLGQIFSLQNVADSSYHAFQASLRRTKGALTIGGSYSYSHSLDDSSDRSDSTFVNSYDLRSNKGSSNFDQRHLLSVSYIYNIPSLTKFLQTWASENGEAPPLSSGVSGFLRRLGDGWQVSGIASFQSGTPFSAINGGSGTTSVLDNAGVANGIGAGSYPDLVDNRDVLPTIGGSNSRSFGPLLGNPNRFQAPRGLTFGNAGRNVLNNPHRVNFDMSLLKHYAISESKVLEFRAEAFNLFNHTQFRVYNPDLGTTGSNTIGCFGGQNYTAGFSALNGVDCVTGSAFLHPVDAHRPRTVQLGVKLNF